MAVPHRIAVGLVVLFAALVGCSKRPKGDEGAGVEIGPDGLPVRSPEPAPRFEAVIDDPPRPDNSPPPDFPPLPALPARPAKYPNTPGGLIAWSLDATADEMITREPPPQETPDAYGKAVFRESFAHVGKTIDELPKRQLDREWYGSGVDATGDRALIDAQFVRFWEAWTQLRERGRRWQVKWSEGVVRRVTRKSARQAREEVERQYPPGRGLRRTGPDLSDLKAERYNWVEVEVTGATRGEWRNHGPIWVTGRVEYADSLKVQSIGPLTASLSGSVGRELTLGALGAAAVIDLAELRCPVVRVETFEEVLIRVGPGIGAVHTGSRKALILARGAPGLRHQGHDPRHKAIVAVVSY
jgi:hypothetical protein